MNTSVKFTARAMEVDGNASDVSRQALGAAMKHILFPKKRKGNKS